MSRTLRIFAVTAGLLAAGAPPPPSTAGSSLLVLERDTGGAWKIRAQTFHVLPTAAPPAGTTAHADGGDATH